MKKNVLITGASRGIGRAAAELFSKKGYHVAAIYNRSSSEAALLERELAGCISYKCDISDLEEVKKLHNKIRGDLGVIDVLINNAGISLRGVFQSLDHSDVKRMYDINLFGMLNVTRVFLNDMINAKSGSIINVSSVFGETGGSCEADYSASKAAVIGFTKALAKEVGPSDIRVNCIAPGIIDTDMNAHLRVSEVSELIGDIPLERLGRPEDIANIMLFLASEESSYITGAVIRADGGFA